MSPENDASRTTDSADTEAAGDHDEQAPGAHAGERGEHGAEAEGVAANADVQARDDASGAQANGESIAGEADTAADAAASADQPDAEADTDESVESLQAKLIVAEAQAAAHWDRLLRLQADVENQRKRAQRDLANARKFALEGIVGDLLPVRDSLEMGIAAAQAEGGSIEKLLEGSELTLKMLAQALEKHEIVEVNPVDEKFNPDFHEAMSMQEVEGKPANTVTAVLQKGYTLNGRLIRPALVMVAR